MPAYVNKKVNAFSAAGGALPFPLSGEGSGDGIRVATGLHPRFLPAMGEGEIYLLFGYTQCRQSRNHFLLPIFYLNQKTLTVQITLAVE